jgi:hypothetical protein
MESVDRFVSNSIAFMFPQTGLGFACRLQAGVLKSGFCSAELGGTPGVWEIAVPFADKLPRTKAQNDAAYFVFGALTASVPEFAE